MGAVRQTRQVTNAMYLMSASRMRRTVQHVEYNRRYFRRVRATVKDILKRTTDLQHRYLEHKSIKSTLYLVIAATNGMCGPYNHNVLKLPWSRYSAMRGAVILITVGRMASAFSIGTDAAGYGTAEIGVDPTLREARQLARTIFDMYDDDVMGEVLSYFIPITKIPWCNTRGTLSFCRWILRRMVMFRWNMNTPLI
jgi:F-type H+-transporting ATPase subunit gamma